MKTGVAAITLGVVLCAVVLGACGSSASKSGAAKPPTGQTLMFRDGWNFVALGRLDTAPYPIVAKNCASDIRVFGFPDEPKSDVGHFAVQAVEAHRWLAGCDAASQAIKGLGSSALAEGGSTELTPYPPPVEQSVAA